MNALSRWPKDKSCVFVTREESDRWLEDAALRSEIRRCLDAEGIRSAPICTLGGYIVDTATPDGWQSGLQP
jgi:hypothetical protein